MKRHKGLIGNDDTETKNLGLTLPSLLGYERIDPIQAFSLPFGEDFTENLPDKPFKATQDLSDFIGLGNSRADWQTCEYRPQRSADYLL